MPLPPNSRQPPSWILKRRQKPSKRIWKPHLAGEQADHAMKVSEHAGKYDKQILEFADDQRGTMEF